MIHTVNARRLQSTHFLSCVGVTDLAFTCGSEPVVDAVCTAVVGSARTGRVLNAGSDREDRSSDVCYTRSSISEKDASSRPIITRCSWLLDIVSHRNKLRFFHAGLAMVAHDGHEAGASHLRVSEVARSHAPNAGGCSSKCESGEVARWKTTKTWLVQNLAPPPWVQSWEVAVALPARWCCWEYFERGDGTRGRVPDCTCKWGLCCLTCLCRWLHVEQVLMEPQICSA